MGAFDSLVETTKFIGRESERLIKEQAAKPKPEAPVPDIVIPGLMKPLPPVTPPKRSEEHELQPPATGQHYLQPKPEPPPPSGSPAMDRFRKVEQELHPPPDFELPDFDAMDPAVLGQMFQSFGSDFLGRNQDFGSDAGLEEYEISGMSAMFSCQQIGAAALKYQGQHDPESAKALDDARNKMFQGYEVQLKEGMIDEAQYQNLLKNLPLLNLDAAGQTTLAEVKSEHPDDYKYWLAAPENTTELCTKYLENLTIPPDVPRGSVERALGLTGRATGAVNKFLLDLPFLQPVLGKGLPEEITLGNIREWSTTGTEALPLPDSMERIMIEAATLGTDPFFLLTMLALPPYGFAAKAALTGEIIAGSAVGGEVGPAVGLPKIAGELIGVGAAVGGGAILRKALSYASPSALVGGAPAPKPFTTSLTGFSENLGKRRWASVSASTEGMSPARQLEANEQLAARLRGLGYDAQVTDGAWLEAGVPTLEKSVFIPEMSAREAAALGAELGQKSVTIPEGILDVATNDLNPVRGAPKLGADLPIGDGYTELSVAGRRIRFSLPIDWERTVPFEIGEAIPLGAQGPPVSLFRAKATVSPAGERFALTTPNQVVSREVGPHTFKARLHPSGDIEVGFSTSMERGPSGTWEVRQGSLSDMREMGKLTRQVVADNPGARVAFTPIDERRMRVFSAAMKKEGLIVDSEGNLSVIGEGGVITEVGEAPSVTFQPGSAEELIGGVSWPWLSRRVYRRVHQVTGKIPILRSLITPMNPQAVLTEPMTRPLAALNGWVDWAAACDRMNLARIYAAPRSGGMSQLLRQGTSVVELTSAGRASQAWWNEGGKTLASWNDILTYGSTYYKLSAVDTKFVGLVQQTLREYGADLKRYGIDIRELLYADGQGWIGRGAQAGKNGIEALQREYSGGRMVGGKGSFTKSRIYETQGEAVKAGVDINKDALDVIATTLTGMRRMQFDAQLTEVAQRFGAKLSDIVSPVLKEAPVIAKAYRTWDKRIADYITAQMKDLTVTRSFRQLRPVAGQVPDTWYSETAGKVQDIVKRFRAEIRGQGDPWKKVSISKIAKPYKAELKELLGSAKLRQQNSMATYFQAKRELEADVMKIRSSLIAGPTERVKPEYFGRFPEDSFAIGTIDSSRWPKLTGRLFPDDIVHRLDRVMNDQGNTVSAAIQKFNDVPRTLGTGADMNFPFIQGMPLLFRSPSAWGKAFSKTLETVSKPEMGMKYMLSESRAHPEEFGAYLKWVRQMGEQEFFQSARPGGFVYKIPGLGKGYARLAQSFDSMLDIGRWEYWKGIYAKAKTDGDFESLGAVTRDLLGTTSTRGLGVSLTQRQIEGGILLFAPRYTRSAFGLLGWAMNPGVAGAEARRSIIQLMTGGTLLFTATWKALDALGIDQGKLSDRLNPLNSGFMSLRIGDNWLGMGGIFRSMIRSVAWSMDAAINDPSRFYDPRRVLDNPVFEFFRSRTSPVSGRLVDIISGEDFIGRPTRSDWDDIANLIRRSVTPFGFETILDAKGPMLPRMGAIVGEFFLGRSTPVSVGQLRDEETYKWAQETGATVHDVNTGKERPPETYRELTDDQRVLFDKANPRYTQDVQDNAKSNARAWAEMDAVSAETERQLTSLETVYNDSNSPHYQDGAWYRSMRGTVFQNARILRERFFEQNPAVERAPTTKEQKWVTDYNETVIKASVDESVGEVDWLLQEQLDRVWRRENGTEASAVVDREYAASMNRLDAQFRGDRLILQPFFDFEDSMWSQDFFTDPNDPISLPSLSNGQKALNFRTSSEYRVALRSDIFVVLQTAGKIPDNLAGIRTSAGGDTLGERFPGKLSDTQVRRASNVMVTYFMRPFYDKQDPIVTEYLKAYPKYMEPLLRWDYWTGSIATEEALP